MTLSLTPKDLNFLKALRVSAEDEPELATQEDSEEALRIARAIARAIFERSQIKHNV